MKMDRPKAPTVIHGPSSCKYHPIERASAIADGLENQFTPYDLCDDKHEWRIQVRFQSVLEAVDNNPPLNESGHLLPRN
jgi:hypothetical protein